MKKIKEYISKNKKEIIFLGIISLLFIILSIFVATEKITYIDSLIHSYILNIRNNTLTSILTIITKLADASFLLAISVILLITIKRKKFSLYIFINLILSFVTNEIFKSIFVRSRPIGINLIDETGLSFPSGHSMVSLSFYGFIVYLLCRNQFNKAKKIILIISLIILVSLIGFSRIYLGVHYLSDVIGGFLLSIIYLTIYIKCIKLEKKWSKWK